MIEIRNLYKRYHNHHGSDWVLKGINLTIPTGVSVGLIGANGAGKSTLLRLIAGMDTPDRGEVIRHSRVSWPVGLSGGMQNNMTGRQNVKFVARAQGSDPSEVKRVIEFVQDFAEIGDAFDEPVRTYSSGMRSRLSFGLSLSFDFDVYISDEATAVGDRAFKAKAQALFKERIGKASLIMVSHGEGILRDLCKAGVYLKNGSAKWYDDINDAITDYHLDTDVEKLYTDFDDKFINVEPAELTIIEIQKIQKELKIQKQNLSSLNALVKDLKKSNWDKKEIDVVRKLNLIIKRKIENLSHLISFNPKVIREKAKAEVGASQRIIHALEYGLELSDKEQWSNSEKHYLIKIQKYAFQNKSQKESNFDMLNGDS